MIEIVVAGFFVVCVAVRYMMHIFADK
jgi:hypothetical protein